MNRAMIVSVLLACAPFAVACDKSGADKQNQVDEAQQKANERIGRANAQANQAKAQEDQAIAAAQADFLQIREDYRHQMQSNLDGVDKDIADLNAELPTATPARKSEIQSALPGVRAQRDAFARDVGTVDDTNMATFDGAKSRLDKEWSDLKAAVDKASR